MIPLQPLHRALRLLPPLLALLACLTLATAILAALGFPPAQVWTVIFDKVLLPDPDRRIERWADILVKSTPLLLTGLCIAIAFRASVWNIGGQGQYVLGAIAATFIGIHPNLPTLPIFMLLAAALAGALLAALAGLLEAWRKVSVVLSTLLLNFIAFGFLSYLLQGPLADGQELGKSPPIAPAAQLPLLGSTRLHAGFFLALALAIFLAFLLNWTTFGFRLRIVGQNPTAARFSGLNVNRISVATLALSGALAGLAGGVEVAGVTHQITIDAARNGYGFTGIAVALLARLSPTGTIAAALFFGLMNQAFVALEAELRVPYVTAQAMQGLIVILMLVMTRRKG